jgi:hypothetical protein
LPVDLLFHVLMLLEVSIHREENIFTFF